MKHARPLALAAALAATLALAACGRGDDPASLIASAKEAVAKQEYRTAVIQLKNALQQEPDNREARYLLGYASLESGDLVSAEVELTKAMNLGLASDEVQVALARTLLAKGDPTAMVSKFGEVRLSTAKQQAEMLALVGMAEITRGRRVQGESALRQALALDAANVTANLGTARLAAIALNYPVALKRIDAALEAAPQSFEAQSAKAEVLALMGGREPAEKAYRDAIALAPRQLPVRVGLIRHLLRYRALDEAAKEVAELEGFAPRDPRVFYAKAMVLIEQRQFPAARDALQVVLKSAPEHVPALTLAGVAALETGALAEAEGHLRKAVFKDPNALGSKRLLAMTHLRMGQNEQALAEIKEVLERSSMDPSVLTVAGEAYLATGDVAAAARHYEEANRLSPKNASIQTRLAQIHLAANDPDRAIRELESASADNPDAHQADLALVATHLRRRDADKALEALRTLEKKQPNNPVTHNLRGVALLLKKDVPGARASFERAVELQPTYMPAVANLVRQDLREKNIDGARRRYEAVLKRAPTNEQALLGMAALLRISNADPKQIEKLVRQAVGANPTSTTARAALVNFYLRSRDSKSALSAAQEAHAAMPNNPQMVQVLGVTQLMTGELRQSVATFTRLTELQPKSHEAQMHLARAYMADKRPEDAIRALRAALALRPDLMQAQRDIAAIYVASNRHQDALQEAKAAQAQHPTQPFGHAMEAEIYVAQKNWDLAERKYRSMLKQFDVAVLVARAHAAMEANNRRKEADAMAEDWIRRHPKDASVLAYLGERDIAARRYASAVKRYQAALERDPDNAQILNNLAWSAHQLKQPQALEYAEQAHEAAPNNAAVLDTLGVILADRGEVERGLELLGRAAELAPTAYAIRLNFAKALVKADRKAAARKELEELAKLDAKLPVQQEASKLLSTL